MTLFRICVLLAGTLAIMLWIVIVRAEATRVHFQIAALDEREATLRTEIQRERVELARWQSPTLIRDRLRELRLPVLGVPLPAQEAVAPPPKPKTKTPPMGGPKSTSKRPR